MPTWRRDWCAIGKSKLGFCFCFFMLGTERRGGITAKVFFPWKRLERWTKTEGRCHTGTGRRKPNTGRRVLRCRAVLCCAAADHHVTTVPLCWVCTDNSVNILGVKASLTLLLQLEDHLFGFLLLGAVSALDLLDLAVLLVQDLRRDGDILVCFNRTRSAVRQNKRQECQRFLMAC